MHNFLHFFQSLKSSDTVHGIQLLIYHPVAARKKKREATRKKKKKKKERKVSSVLINGFLIECVILNAFSSYDTSELFMLIMLGATATFTFSHCSAFDSPHIVMTSMAAFSVSMPVGWFTSVEPKYWAFNTFFGSSIGVGNDCANEQKQQQIYCHFIVHIQSRYCGKEFSE